jgi:hypothetical protein
MTEGNGNVKPLIKGAGQSGSRPISRVARKARPSRTPQTRSQHARRIDSSGGTKGSPFA